MYEIGPFTYNFRSSAKEIRCPERICLAANEFVVIAGPSGSGKSTLLQMLKGIIPQFSSGKLDGHILYKKLPLIGPHFENNLREILFLFQNPFSQLIFPWAKEEFFFSMENFGFTKEQMDQKKEELFAEFELDGLWEKKTTELSTGQCQRLVLASLMAIGPEVLLLDEPTAFLDPKAREHFYQWLAKSKGKRTIVIVDHHLDEVLHLADKIIYVNDEGLVSQVSELPLSLKQKVILPPFMLKKEPVEIKVKNLSFHYESQKNLIEDITLSAQSEDIVVVKGNNGQGKSTFFKLMASLLKPHKGNVDILINNELTAKKEHHRKIGFIFQNPESHFFYDTIAEELDLKKKGQELLKFYELFFKNVDTGRSPFLLSEGEKRRLSILMTVFHEKSILFYDEPTFGQDPASIETIRQIILYLKTMGKIQFIISHDEAFIKSLNAHEYELTRGRLVKVQA